MSKFTCGYPSDSRKITSPYGPRNIGDGWHDGVDFAHIDPIKGDPMYAMHDGVVAYVGYVGGYGDNVIIVNAYDKYGTKYSTLLAHGKDVLVSVKDHVTKGQRIATVWKTGTSAIHCHCEVRTQWYNPDTYWNKHYRNGGGEFYSSYDPMDYIVDDPEPDLIEEMKMFSKIKQLVSELKTCVDEFDRLLNK